MEWNPTPRRIFASSVLCHTLVCPSIFLLEIRYFKDSVWILHFDFAGERDAAGSPPAYFWDRAAKEEQKVPVMATVSRIAVIKVWLSTKERVSEQKPCGILLPANEIAIAQISEALKTTLISALLWMDESKNE